MKQGEFKKCAGCQQGMMHQNNPMFLKVSISRMVINMGAVNRRHGMEMMTGSSVIAGVLGPDEDIANALDTAEILLCGGCALESVNLSVLLEGAKE